MAQERLQKLLARAGLASRRKAEELITSGRVRVDGKIVTELGSKADTRAKIEVDGQKIAAEQHCYGILHKPRQMMTTLSDPEGRPTIGDILRKVGLRVVPVGRLDFNTSGALLFTNDGDFAQALGHPSSSAPKVYVAKVRGELTEAGVARFRDSIDIEGKKTRPADVRVLRRENGNTWLEVTLSEGKNRQIRRLGEHADATVIRLARMSHAGISTDGVRVGEYRLLTSDELQELKAKYGVPKKIRGAITEEEMNALPRKRPATGQRAISSGRPKGPRTRVRPDADDAPRPSLSRSAGAPKRTRAVRDEIPAWKMPEATEGRRREVGERKRDAAGVTGPRASSRVASASKASTPGRSGTKSWERKSPVGPSRVEGRAPVGPSGARRVASGKTSASRPSSDRKAAKPLDRERGSSHRRKTRS